MLKYFFLSTLFISISMSSYSQCGETGLELLVSTEEEILELIDCDTIFGSLTISGSDISYLDGLQNIEHIEENLTIESCFALLNVDSLYNLNSIGGDLSLLSNFTLLNVQGFSGLEYVDGDINIITNWSITDLEGMENLTEVDGDIFIDNNNTLENLNGFDNLEAVNGSFTLLTNNMVFDNLSGLNALETIEDDLIISVNSLTTINGLENLTEVGGNLELIDLTLLANVDGFASLETVGNDLIITNDSTLVNVDSLYNLSYVGGDLNVHSNPGLFLCCGLNNVLANGTVDGEIQVFDNALACSDVETILEDCWTSIEEPNALEVNVYRSDLDQLKFIGDFVPDSFEIYDLFGRKIYDNQKPETEDFTIQLPNNSFFLWKCTKGNFVATGVL